MQLSVTLGKAACRECDRRLTPGYAQPHAPTTEAIVRHMLRGSVQFVRNASFHLGLTLSETVQEAVFCTNDELATCNTR